MLQFGLRLGDRPRQLVTTTPRATRLMKRLLAEADVGGFAHDNAGERALACEHLPASRCSALCRTRSSVDRNSRAS